MANAFMLLTASLLFLVLAFTVYGQIYNRLRKNCPVDFRLIPNCLLTRFPIVFISGPESIFYRGQYWNFVPKALREHGYEVFELQPLDKSKEERTADLVNFASLMTEEGLSCHWICHGADHPILEKISLQHPKAFRSLTAPVAPKENLGFIDLNVFLHGVLKPSAKVNAFLVGHPKFDNCMAVIKFYLNIAVRLAEVDYQHHEDANENLPTESVRS